MTEEAAAGVRTLFLLRHAKSSWEDSKLKDIDRPLNPRGRKSCKLMGEQMAARGVNPAIILCSPSVRTRETLERLGPVAGLTGEARFDPRLYAADAAGLLQCLRELPADIPQILLIGHNPAIQELALMLARRGRLDVLEQLERKFPTCALAQIRLAAADWANVSASDGALVSFDLPKQLKRQKARL
ncbi:MAG: histidine phosphatase family protein [Rhodothalassiaceae bacterium]